MRAIIMILGIGGSFMALGADTGSGQDGRDAAMSAWRASVLNLAHITKYSDGEDLAWRVSPYLRGMALMAEATGGDRECMDLFVRAFDHIMSIASTDIDGLFGWPTTKGSYGTNGKRCIIMDDALVCEPVAIFHRVANASPELQERYGERADAYLKFVEEKIFSKWGESWLELRDKTPTIAFEGTAIKRFEAQLPEPAGVYRFFEPGKKPGKSLPLNQFWHVARCYLALYDATRKPDYLDKVTKMARTGKYLYLESTGDRARPWHYWKPVHAGDFKGEHEPAGWSGPHPERASYAAFEVAMMAEFHRRKIVFTDEDIRRVTKLHLDFQWNKDSDNPKFDYRYDRRPGYDKPYPAILWTSLASFDPTIAKMSAPYRKPEYIVGIADKWAGIVGVPQWLLDRKAAGEGR